LVMRSIEMIWFRVRGGVQLVFRVSLREDKVTREKLQ